MGLLIFFLVAFAAAFTVIMNDREGFGSFGVSMLTSATMAMGEFDFKETFLKDEYAEYNTFYWLRMVHLVGFFGSYAYHYYELASGPRYWWHELYHAKGQTPETYSNGESRINTS